MESRSNQNPSKSGRALAGASALALYAGCILMPLAGRAGAAASHAGANRLALTAVWVSGLLLGLGAVRLGGGDRAVRRPAPVLAGLHALLLVLLWSGALGR